MSDAEEWRAAADDVLQGCTVTYAERKREAKEIWWRGYRAGLEAAAQWHEEQRATALRMLEIYGRHDHAVLADCHERAQRNIRALAPEDVP